ncbi:conserved protein [Tepidicaulis marinus]|jgi:hypothetical protein|uniref:Conserved protein n=1 Tax=Tepidicaulis marinus TaxID=1333998 RepID=A0A081BAJ1_9HYPH|nr:DUF2007 domain-containing protein [Tepidicaulis marinus]GAK45059.1 conserved protein [Tepidicaulis marinus]
MKEILRTTDPVLLSALDDALRQAGIEPLQFDTHMSIVEGSLGVLPRRMMVADEDAAQALRVLEALRREAEES